MKADDLIYLKRAVANHFKERYKNLEQWFPPSEEKQLNKHYIICFNATQLVNLFDDLEAQFIDSGDFLFHAMIELLNVLGHYKHFYTSRLKGRTTVILYLNSYRDYQNHKVLLDKVKKACDYFPGIFYIEPISQKENSYPHIVRGVIECLKAKDDAKNIQTVIHVYSIHTVDMQLMLATTSPDNRVIKMMDFRHIVYTRNTLFTRVFGDKEMYYKSLDKPTLEALIIPLGLYMGTLVKGANPVTVTLKKGEKLQTIRQFVEINRGVTGEKLIESFAINLIPSEFQDLFMKYIKEHDFNYNKYVIDIVKDLIATWSNKIKDFNVIKEDTKVKILQEHSLNLNWVLF
jgi:hypothetical protein